MLEEGLLQVVEQSLPQETHVQLLTQQALHQPHIICEGSIQVQYLT